jgi:hypothetical protein
MDACKTRSEEMVRYGTFSNATLIAFRAGADVGS